MSKRKERAWRSLAQDILKALDPQGKVDKKKGPRYTPPKNRGPKVHRKRAVLLSSDITLFQGKKLEDQGSNNERGLFN